MSSRSRHLPVAVRVESKNAHQRKKKRAHWQSKSIRGKRTWKRDSNSRHLPQGAGSPAQEGSSCEGCGWVLRALAEIPEVASPADYEPLLTRALYDLATRHGGSVKGALQLLLMNRYG